MHRSALGIGERRHRVERKQGAVSHRSRPDVRREGSRRQPDIPEDRLAVT